MRIVIGRGIKRRVYSFDCGFIISQNAKVNPVEYRETLLKPLCKLIGLEIQS